MTKIENIFKLASAFSKAAAIPESCQVGSSCGGNDVAFNYAQWEVENKAFVESVIQTLQPEQNSMLYGTPGHFEKSWLLFVLQQMVDNEPVDGNDQKLAFSDWRLNYANNERISRLIDENKLKKAIFSYKY